MNVKKELCLVMMTCFFVIIGSSALGAQGPIIEPIAQGNVRAHLELVADNLVAPAHLTHANDGSGRLFVMEQSGEIRLINNGTLAATPYLDTSSLLVPLGGLIPPFQDPFSDYDERGLLGLAFHPDFANVGATGFGRFYTYTSEEVSGAADFTVDFPPGDEFNHQSVVREWTVDPNSNNVQGAVSRELMRIDQPQFNHNGGALEFGQDNNLYVALGDGGAARDDAPGHGQNGNGQDGTNVLGSILRVDPLGNNSANGQYGVPNDNPFVGSLEVDEIFALGFRNPYRISFDSTGSLIVADVGQNNIEEVDIVTSGENYGWRYKEGSFYYDHINNVVSDDPIDGITPPGFESVDPVLEYDHDEGISIIGGLVYELGLLPELDGKYIFGDFSRQFFSPDGRLFYGDLESGEILEFLLEGNADLELFVKGFGAGEDGEIYLLAGTNLGPFRDASGQGYGAVYRLSFSSVPEPCTAVGLVCLGLTSLLTRRRKS